LVTWLKAFETRQPGGDLLTALELGTVSYAWRDDLPRALIWVSPCESNTAIAPVFSIPLKFVGSTLSVPKTHAALGR
jgi:hypothetical protein